MRRYAILLTLMWYAGASTVAAANDWNMVLLYARALQRFNPALDGRVAVNLASATIAEADRERLDARLLVAVIAVESNWHPQAISHAGAVGLGQLMPETATALAVDPHEPQANIHGAAVYLRALLTRFAGVDLRRQYIDALAAYNAGPGAVERYGGVPPYPETRSYVRRVMELWARLAGV